MKRWTPLLVAVFLTALVVMGCSAGTSSPMTPGTSTPNLTQSATPQATQTHLWGYYDLYFDFENQTVEAVFNRATQFTANVVTFVNNPPTNLAFNIHGTPVGADYIDVDIDVSITHPFAGLNQYDGYDVRGVFVGAGSETLEYGSGLRYAAFGGSDQVMFDYELTESDPYDGPVGNPDGYTRWFNPPEFPAAGVLGYTPGRFATPGYTGTATLNPYKYFADGLGADDDLVEFLSDPGYTDNGVFTAGTTNTRNYYLRFPIPTPGVKYGYAIVASWEDPEDPNFQPPNNCVEAIALDYDVEPDLYFVEDTNKGGDFIADFDVYGWGVQPSTLTVETTVHSTPMTYDCATISAGGTELYSTYEVEFTVDNLTTNTSAGGMDEFWVILEYSGLDYGSVFSPTGTYPEQPLAAFFRYDLYVSDTPYNADPVCDLQLVGPTMPYAGFAPMVEFDASGSYDPDAGDVLSYSWDFDGDGTYGDSYDGGTDEAPIKMYDSDYNGNAYLMLTDGNGGETICSVPLDITAYPSKNIDVTNGTTAATDITMDNTNGDILVYYGPLGQVRRYTISSYYQSYTTMNVLGHAQAEWIVSNDLGDFLVTYWSGSSLRGYYYSPTGTQYSGQINHGFGTLSGVLDNVAMPNDGYHPNAMGAFVNWHISTTTHYSYGHFRYGSTYSSAWYPAESVNPSATPNASYVKPDNVVGMESDPSGDSVWVCQTTEGYVNRYQIANFEYDGAYFGTPGTPGDDDSHLADPRDITKDSTGTYYILDELSSGDFVIKGFTASGSSTTAITSFGSSVDWAYDPIRIDGSDFNDFLTVLQLDGTDSYISVFPQ